jgi:hypothetical protein
MSLGQVLRNKTHLANEKIVKDQIDKLYGIATHKANEASNKGSSNAWVTINTVEYDDDRPFFDFTYNSPMLYEKVVPEVIKMLKKEDIEATLKDGPACEVSHKILRLKWD